MIRKGFGLIICLYLLSNIHFIALAEESLEDIIRARSQDSKGLAQNIHSKEEIPQYSEAKQNEIADKLGSSHADDLKKEGAKLRDEHIEQDPSGIMATMVEVTDIKKVTGDNCKNCEKYSELQMFTESDRYMRDPISQMDLIKSQGCVDENDDGPGYIKQENIETYEDTTEKLRICEKPITKFKCTRTLSLECKSLAQCDYGGIAKGSFSEGLIYEISGGGALTIGRDADNYYEGECATFNEIVHFHVSKLDLISIFKITRLKFDDYIELKLNGHIVYVGPDGGEYVRVEKENGKNMVFNGKSYKECERAIDQDEVVQVDLKPHLKQGENVLEIKLIVGGKGEAWIEIQAQQQCCENNNWEETWIENCE
jgi:hypothetical protein